MQNFKQPAVILTLALLCLGQLASEGRQPVEDFAAFKEKREQLPSRQEIVSVAARRDGFFPLGVTGEVKVPTTLLPTKTYSNEQTSPPILTAAVLKELSLDLKEINVAVWDKEKEVLTFKKSYKVYSSDSFGDCNLIKEQSLDLDGNGLREKYFLQRGKLEVNGAVGVIWRTPDDWWVENFVLGDANNDGVPDLNLSVWKAGSFGPCKPFWIIEEDNEVKNHLFIFNLVNGSFKPVWQSSNLERFNYELALIDINNDGQNELLVLEGNYANPREKRVNVWQWNGWGFTCLTGP